MHHNAIVGFIYCGSAPQPRLSTAELLAKANENLLNILVFHPLEIWPQLIKWYAHSSESTMVFMVALHFLQQLVAMDHKAMNTLTNGVLREIRMTFYIDFFSPFLHSL